MTRPSLLLVYNTTPIGAAGVYDSAWVRARLQPIPAGATTVPVYYERKRIRGSVVTDQASAANGFQIQFADRDDQTDSYVAFQAGLVANTVQTFDVLVTAKWVRVELTNGAVAQTTLTLGVYLEDD